MIVVYTSSHGWGHAMQTVPIVDELFEQNVEFITTAPEWFIKTSLFRQRKGKVIVRSLLTDPGCVQSDPFTIDIPKSIDAWKDIISKYPEIVESEVKRLRRKHVKLVISNISFIGQLVAEQLQVPSICIGTFDWKFIYSDYLDKNTNIELTNYLEEATKISSRFDYCLIPGTICKPLTNGKEQKMFHWLSRKPRMHGVDMRKILGLNFCQDAVLLSFGGFNLKEIDPSIFSLLCDIDFYLMIPESEIQRFISFYQNHPKLKNSYVIPPPPKPSFLKTVLVFLWDFYMGYKHLPIYHIPKIHNLHLLPSEIWSAYHVDVVNAVDLVFGKISYGLCTEAITCHKPMLAVSRPGNPECSVLLKSASKHIPLHVITKQQFLDGDWFEINQLLEIDQNDSKNLVKAETDGEKQIAHFIRKLLNEDENPIEPKDPLVLIKKYCFYLVIFLLFVLCLFIKVSHK